MKSTFLGFFSSKIAFLTDWILNQIIFISKILKIEFLLV
ncbi:hypothetical protein SGADD02_00322 [Streptococcus gallolyticus]|uniref:Uncharacterized protein n=1 Tax=Streptococcus gallolyticus TaxID=315405 RepID=A0A139R412_9STRE|nr:hypothetical protein SGADD02_00322 [Streptococcus gallolyticus]KXU09570.1 hypothetical protein SGADD03_00692 [Streptococcus gallolyticus]